MTGEKKMIQILGNFGARGIGFIWHINNDSSREEGLVITFNPYTTQDRESLEVIRDKLVEAGENWLYPIQHPLREWEVDIMLLKQKKQFSELANVTWLNGKIQIIPEIIRGRNNSDGKVLLQINFMINPHEL